MSGGFHTGLFDQVEHGNSFYLVPFACLFSYRYSSIMKIEFENVIARYNWAEFFQPGVGVGIGGLLVGSSAHPECDLCCVCRHLSEPEVSVLPYPTLAAHPS